MFVNKKKQIYFIHTDESSIMKTYKMKAQLLEEQQY